MGLWETLGKDGLTKESNETFGDELREIFLDSVREAKEIGLLSTSQRQTIIKLIEKKDRDKRFIKNWRLISILNVDLKINVKALSEKLKVVLPDLISSQQSKYVKIEITEIENVDGFLVPMDIEKAFDSLDHNFLISTLEKYGFGQNFILWVEILLKDQESCVINPGKTTKYILLGRGPLQGDPISAFLFVLALEILLSLIIATSAYADDTIFFIKDTISIINMVDTFCTFHFFRTSLD